MSEHRNVIELKPELVKVLVNKIITANVWLSVDIKKLIPGLGVAGVLQLRQVPGFRLQLPDHQPDQRRRGKNRAVPPAKDR